MSHMLCLLCLLWCSCYEIYGGKVFDLLNGRKKLDVREDGRKRVQVGAAWLGCVALCWAGWAVAGLQPALTCLLQKSSATKQPALAWAALLAQTAASDMSCLATRPCLPAGGAAGAG